MPTENQVVSREAFDLAILCLKATATVVSGLGLFIGYRMFGWLTERAKAEAESARASLAQSETNREVAAAIHALAESNRELAEEVRHGKGG
jgi:type II secretory pathway pseudopilin PulG